MLVEFASVVDARALRGRVCSAAWPSAMLGVPTDAADRIPHRHQPRRHHRRGRRHLRRRRQCRRAAGRLWPSRAASASRRAVHEHVRDKLDLAFEDMGEQTLKNIARPVRVYRVAAHRGREAISASPPKPAERSAAARQAVDRGAAVPEHERRSRAGIFRRRHGRGNHHRAVAHPLAVRDRPQFDLHLQGPSRRCEAGRARTWRALCARRLGAQRRQPGAHHRAADRRR